MFWPSVKFLRSAFEQRVATHPKHDKDVGWQIRSWRIKKNILDGKVDRVVESAHSVVTFCNKHQKAENSKRGQSFLFHWNSQLELDLLRTVFGEWCFKDLGLPFCTSELKMVRNKKNRINYAWLDTYLLLPRLATFLLSSSDSSWESRPGCNHTWLE